MHVFTKTHFKISFLLLTLSLFISTTLVIAQDSNSVDTDSKDKKEKNNGEQPARYNFRRLVKDPNSPFYNQNSAKWPKDNVKARFDYDYARFKDPKTGLVPDDIRQKELEYVRSAKARLIRDNGNSPLGRGGPNIKTAAGDQSSSWVNRGPYNVGGRTRALALDIDDENIILAGGVSGGMWRSTNQGVSWTRVTAADQHPGITDVVQDPRAGFHDTWYYSTGERIGASQSARNNAAFYGGNGIYKSTDNGITWTLLTATEDTAPQSFSNPFDLIFGLAIHPTTGDLYVATWDGIQRSTNGGTTFQEVLPSDRDNFADIHITSTGVLYVTLDSGAGAVGTSSGIFRSTDGGLGSWVNITDPGFPGSFGRTVVYSAPSNPDILYVLSDDTGASPVDHDFWKYTYVSGDGTGTGGVWEDRSANLPNFGGFVGDFDSQGGYDLYVRVHPTDPDFVLIGGTNIFRSTDGFATSSGVWVAGYSPINNISLYTNHHPDQHSLVFLPSDPNIVISGHDGGISITSDITSNDAGNEPVEWSSLNNGYLTTQVYALSIGPDDQLMSGFQDNSTWFTNNTNPTDEWVDLFSGDGSYNAFNDDGTLRYMSSQLGNVFRVTYPNANSSNPLAFRSLEPAGSSGALFVAPFELDPNDDNIMYFAAGNTVWRNDNLPNATNTVGWTQLNNNIVSGSVSSIGISENPANVVYIGSTAGSIIRIDDAHTGNPTGVNVSLGKGLPSGNIASIDVNPFNADDLIVAFSNYSIPSIFRSTDGGDTWQDVSGNLEENPNGSGAGPSVRWVASVGNNDRYFAGTSTGLYSTTELNGISTIWTQEDLQGIRNTVVEQIRTRDIDGLVVVGTHGNGLFSADYEVSSEGVLLDNVIENFTVEANSDDTQIDVSSVFKSSNEPPLTIAVGVADNTNPSLVTTMIDGNILSLSYAQDNFGLAMITIIGEDTNGSTEETSFTVTVNPPPIDEYPYIEDFQESLLLPVGWSTDGTVEWIRNSGNTPSGETGPSTDHTLGNANGFYLYSEVADLARGDQGSVKTIGYDLRSLENPVLQFHYHMFGSDIGTLEVEVIDVTNNTETRLIRIDGEQQGNQNDAYLSTGSLDLFDFKNSVISLRFTSTAGPSFRGDIAVDDIRIFERPEEDLAITSFIIPGPFADNQPISVRIENLGAMSQTDFDVSYKVDDEITVTEVFTDVLESRSSSIFTFSTTANLQAVDTFSIQAFTELLDDIDRDNDTLKGVFVDLPVADVFPYLESFESGSGGWTSGGVSSSWELGVPSNSIINSAADGDNAWVTNLDGQYNTNEQSYVISPLIDLQTTSNPVLILDILGSSELNFDGAQIQYSDDRGFNWRTLGFFGDPDNWYNEEDIDGLDFTGVIEGWDDTSGNDWVQTIHPLDGLEGRSDILLRVVFGSNGSIAGEGFAFDNVRVVDLAPPANISFEDVQLTSFNASWDEVDEISEYEVNVSSDGFTTILTGFEDLAVDQPSVVVTGLTDTLTYQIKVESAMGSYRSESAIATVVSVAPSALTATKGENGVGIILNWTDNAANEDDFVIERSEDASMFTTIDSVGVNETTFLDATTAFGINYSYRVAARKIDSLSAYSNVASLLVTGIEDQLFSGSIKVSPNPSEGVYNLTLKDIGAKQIELTIWNSIGKLVMTKLVDMGSGDSNVKLDLLGEESGIYLLKLNADGDRVAVRKLMIE